MNSIRQFLWKMLVMGMIPFILGAGLPQMACGCAAAKGQRWCECCFVKPNKSQDLPSPLKPCCQRRLAAANESKSMAAQKSASGCPTCHQFRNPQTGSCCSLKQADAPTLSKLVDAPDSNVSLLWLPLASDDLQALVQQTNTNHGLFSRARLIPPIDRVIVFEHLLI